MPKAEGKPVAIYTRISLDRAGTSPSPARQEDECRKLIESYGLVVGDAFSDVDVSAYTRAKRPGFEALLVGIDNGLFGGICVWKFDRLVRRFTDYADILPRIERAGAAIYSATERIDTTTTQGKMYLGILAAQAEQESENTSLRVAAAEKGNARRGRPHGGGKRTFGYNRIADGGLSINDEEAQQLRLVRADLQSGQSVRQCAIRLNERGSRTTTGRPWTWGTLVQTLRSPKMRGYRTHKGRLYVGDWEPIFSEEEHLALLDLISSRSPKSPNRTGSPSLLSGLVRCGICGERLYRTKLKGSDGTLHPRYTCTKQPGRSNCGGVSVVMKRLDEYVVGCAIEYEDQYGPNARTDDTGLDAEIDELQAVIVEDQKNITNLYREKYIVRDATMSAPLEQVIDELANKITIETARIADLIKKQSRLNEWKGQLRLKKSNEYPWHPSQPMPVRRAWIRQYVSQIDVNPASVKGARFDSSRIDINWTLGDYTPEIQDDAAARQWNEASQIMESS